MSFWGSTFPTARRTRFSPQSRHVDPIKEDFESKADKRLIGFEAEVGIPPTPAAPAPAAPTPPVPVPVASSPGSASPPQSPTSTVLLHLQLMNPSKLHFFQWWKRPINPCIRHCLRRMAPQRPIHPCKLLYRQPQAIRVCVATKARRQIALSLPSTVPAKLRIHRLFGVFTRHPGPLRGQR